MCTYTSIRIWSLSPASLIITYLDLDHLGRLEIARTLSSKFLGSRSSVGGYKLKAVEMKAATSSASGPWRRVVDIK